MVVRRSPPLLWPALVFAAMGYVYLSRLNAAGLLGPDEPRYASIAREMARSGDWITPRLWGRPWFEKPALLYWMSAAGFRLHLGPELAPRLPVALVALAFLGFYWWILRREFGPRPAAYAVVMLATSLGWIGFSQVGATDLPMTAAFSAAMLLALPWIGKGERRCLPLVGGLLGLAVLAKGLVPVVLAAPLMISPLLDGRGPEKLARWRSLFDPRVLAAFLVVALPWYVLCYLRNGRPFVEVFFWQQQFQRFGSPALQHVQPWWFYIPVLLAGLLPWTPLALLISPRRNWQEPRRRFLLLWVVFGLAFFSLAVNKLPGYVLPLLPALCALAGIGIAEGEGAGPAAAPALAGSGVLLLAFPFAGQTLPQAVASGLSHAGLLREGLVRLEPALPLALIAGALVWWLARRGRHAAGFAIVALCAASGYVYLKFTALPQVDAAASGRGLWRQVQGRRDQTCIDTLNRDFRYGLNYYAETPLPDCSAEPRPFAIRQGAGQTAGVVLSRRK